jgi:hypothetical protein
MASEVVGADRDDENTIAPLTLAATHRLASGKRRQDTEALR